MSFKKTTLQLIHLDYVSMSVNIGKVPDFANVIYLII